MGRELVAGVELIRDEQVDLVSSDTGFAAWVAPHLAVMVAVAVREVGANDADDLVQDTVLRAWQRREKFDADRGSPRAWLLTLLLSQARRRRVRGARHAPVHDGNSLADSADTADRQVSRIDLEAAVSNLPRRQREVVTLYYLAELGVADVAAVLGIRAGTVKSHLSDARATLRRSLESS